VAVDNRLTAEELAGLVPGDWVTIEFARDFRRPKHVAGMVVRNRDDVERLRRLHAAITRYQ
jgi:hypothetical protein